MGKGRGWLQQKLVRMRNYNRKQARQFRAPRASVGNAGHTPEGIRTMGFSPAPPSVEIDISHLFTMQGKPQIMARVVQSDRLQGMEVWKPLTVAEDKRMRLIVLVSRNDHIFVRVCKITNTYKRSFLYETRGEALGAYNHGRIQWRKDVYVFPSV